MNTLGPQSQFLNFIPERAAPLRGPEVGQIVRDWAARSPDAPGLLHKRRGRWEVFTWAHIEHEVARLESVLRARAGDGAIRLAISGAYEPDLVTLSLAALSAGGRVFPVSPTLHGHDLTREIAGIAPTHAFVQRRRGIGQWLAARPAEAAAIPLFATHAFVGGNSAWQVVPLRDPVATLARRRTSRAPLRRPDIVWIDEGTEWSEGLARLLDPLLDHGRTVAFPEASASALRDRREVQPGALIVSFARHARMAEEDRARRAPEGSLVRRLTDKADRQSLGLLGRFIDRRRRVGLGLGGLARCAPEAAAPLPPLAVEFPA